VDKDNTKLEKLYEDLSDQNIPQYGSVAPIVVTPMGTETLKSAYVEVPEDADTYHESDDEDSESKSKLEDILSNLKDAIIKAEDKIKQRRINQLEDLD